MNTGGGQPGDAGSSSVTAGHSDQDWGVIQRRQLYVEKENGTTKTKYFEKKRGKIKCAVDLVGKTTGKPTGRKVHKTRREASST